MIYHTSCPYCKNNWKFPFKIPPQNNQTYQITCPEGHKFSLDIYNNHFQLLFENALYSLSEGFYIESLTCFASSYERFMEFFIRVIYFSNNIHDDCFEKTWKLLSSRSERQVGAFLITYIQEFKEKPPLLSNKMTELRNNAIHKGHIPTKEECIKYGEAILNFIRPIVFLLKKNQKYAWQVVGSANNYGLNNFENKKYSTFANQIFPINRIVSERDSLSITELMEEQQKLIKAYSMAKDKK